MRVSRATVLAVLFLAAAFSLSAKDDPVQWTLEPYKDASNVKPGGHSWLQLTAKIQPGWHLYSPTTPPGGPIITSVKLNESPAIASYQVYRPQPVRKLDPNFQLETETYIDQAVFLIDATTTSKTGQAAIEAAVRYQACNDVKCLNPVKKTAGASITIDSSAPASTVEVPAGYALVPASAPAAAAPTATASSSAPASKPAAFGSASSQQDLLPFLLTAFGFGLAALFTPCVFPMIPITVSFFLNQNSGQQEKKSSGWTQALVFCLGIIVLFTGLGFLVTALAGPFGVVQLGSSPWVNSFIAIVFFIFGLSLLGAFELTLPSGLLTKLDRASQGGGYAGTLLMGLTFSLTSFACIGPIVGPLLIASVQ
ncbi:MAG: cytochrome c biogenesis protein CcdA, partial [Bryobacteraceae bacterium]